MRWCVWFDDYDEGTVFITVSADPDSEVVVDGITIGQAYSIIRAHNEEVKETLDEGRS